MKASTVVVIALFLTMHVYGFDQTNEKVQNLLKTKQGAGLDFSGADLSHVNLDGVNLDEATLNEANFSYTSLQNAHLKNVTAHDTNFCYANLSGADLSYANLSGTGTMERQETVHFMRKGKAVAGKEQRKIIKTTRLSYAKCTAANLHGANLNNADLNYADFSNADMTADYGKLPKPMAGATVVHTSFRDAKGIETTGAIKFSTSSAVMQ